MSGDDGVGLPPLDETTWYSVLGLTSIATETEIRKSYMKLAKQLHPDKTKNLESAELFKIVVNAHSLLTDPKEREQYDRQLRIRNLYEYDPLGLNTRNIQSQEAKYTSKPRRRAYSYDKQPYGFGLSTSTDGKKSRSKSPEKSSVPIFQSFNMKSYQRSYNRKTELDKEEQEYNNNSFRDKPQGQEEVVEETKHKGEERDTINASKRTMDEESFVSFDNTEQKQNISEDFKEEINSRNNENQTNTDVINDEPGMEMENNGFKRKKMSSLKPDHNDIDEKDRNNWNRNLRRTARNKQETREQVRRSVSPLKKGSLSDHKGLRDTFTSGINEVINKLYNSMDNESNTVRSSEDLNDLSLGDTPTKKLSSHRRSLNDTCDMGENDPIFNMDNINDTLESIPMSKKAKLETEYGELPHTENIHEPVNQTLPRYYKKDSIPMEDSFNMTKLQKILSVELPNIILPHMNQLVSLYQLDKIRQELTAFNEACNQVKEMLIGVYQQKIRYDMSRNTQLFKIENQIILQQSNFLNQSIINKINEIEQHQQIAIQRYLEMCRRT